MIDFNYLTQCLDSPLVLQMVPDSDFTTNTPPKIKNVIFNEPATIVFWEDGTKTVVTCDNKYDKFDKEKGLALCFMKKNFGNSGKFNNILKEHCCVDMTEKQHQCNCQSKDDKIKLYKNAIKKQHETIQKLIDQYSDLYNKFSKYKDTYNTSNDGLYVSSKHYNDKSKDGVF